LAKTADVAAKRWTLFDIGTTMLGVRSAFLDFPDLAICAHHRLPHGNPSYTKTPDATRSF